MLGTTSLPDHSTRFQLWAPFAHRLDVHVLGGPAAGVHQLSRREDGLFEGTIAGVGAGTDYAYSLDGGPLRPDPVSRWQPEGVHGPSRVVDPSAFAWSDGAWRGIEMADHVIYELHVGTFTAEGTFDAAIAHLDALARLGITAIELMPVAQFPGARNWGYDGVLLYAPQNTYGGPEGLRRLVDAAHARGLAVVLDVVYNHLGPEGNWLGEFGPYFTEHYHTPWGAAVNYDGAGSDEVRRFVVENAVYWIDEFHVDALRLDAVHGIYDFGAHHILAELAERVHARGAALGRRVQVIAESDLNDPRLLRPASRGGYGLDAQWSDDFHHAAHVALTGERTGYYAGFHGLADLARAIERRFVYEGQHAPHRRRRHGASAMDVPTDRFVIALQNHDQVGNRAMGDRLSTLLSPERLRLAAALLLLSPYVPLLFMGDEYGETHPFLYFTSHGDPELARAVREGRRSEFASFAWAGEIPDPQAEETFLRSRLDRSVLERGDPAHRALLAVYHDVLAIRREEPALRPGAVEPRAWADDAEGWLAVELAPAAGAPLLALHNLSGEDRGIPVGGAAGRWRLRFSTRDPRYGGPGDALRSMTCAAGARITVPPESAALYIHEDL
ncbi:MAG TPA: malto-oligosyltrehalose trehalohydrolase [Gemmatimonadaceae bacterium]|nr:malto-oligosyltrehalose trehalohydrolase [Gemmatimonadaceae bacterium]